MKNLLLTLLAAFVLAACLLAGASILLTSSVEDMAMDALSAQAGPQAELAVGSLKFSPISRALVITDIRTRRNTPGGAVSTSIPHFRGIVPVRCLLAQLPGISSLLYGETSLVPVLERCRVDTPASTGAGLTFKAEKIAIGDVRLAYPLLREYSAGNRPPYAQAVEGIYVSDVRIEKLALTQRSGRGSIRANARSLTADAVHRGQADRLAFAGLTLEIAAEKKLSAGMAEFENVFLAPLLLPEPPDRHSRNLAPADSLLDRLARRGIPAERLKVRNLSLPFEGGKAFAADELAARWIPDPHAGPGPEGPRPGQAAGREGSGRVVPAELHLRGGELPAAVLEQAVGMKLSGMEAIPLEGDMECAGRKDEAPWLDVKGILRAGGLCDLSFDGALSGERPEMKDTVLVLKDYSLTARLAAGVSPDAHVTAMLLKAGAMSLCANDAGEQRRACMAITQFIDQPGTITVATRRGLAVSIERLVARALTGSLGSLFDITAQPGAFALTRQVDELSGRTPR